MLIGILLLVGGMVLIIWGAELFTDGAIRTATRFALSPFYVGAVVSGFEPENLVTGVAAAVGDLPQIALGTVIGSTVFLLTGALGLVLLVVPMSVGIPRQGPIAMIASLALLAATLWNDGTVSRAEGALLVLAAVGLMVWLYRCSPAFQRAEKGNVEKHESRVGRSAIRALGLLIGGVAVLLVGAKLVVAGVHALVSTARFSETFLGMAIVGMGESLEETARMMSPARRGHPELAWGNVVGTVVILLTLNLGIIALVRPVVADPLVLRWHAPFLVVCTLGVASALLVARQLGRAMGALLLALYGTYLAMNLTHMWQ